MRPSVAASRSSAQIARSSGGPTRALFSNFKLPSFGGTASSKLAKRETIIPDPSYNIPAVLLGTAGASHFLLGNDIAAGISGILGVFLAVQASRVKFIFEDEYLEVVIGEQKVKSENAFVGGENRWKYDTFVNWEFWWPGFPVLVYFKETQTKPEGQIHFFPLIFNGKQVYEVMVERCGSSKNSGPK
ncbi:hypothetical protein Ndes2526B_g00133 [Nannochloris sp. 'desiccata']|nr:hypothetical protein NADE_001987 [Chlorella desiccata (nom. nud.)]